MPEAKLKVVLLRYTPDPEEVVAMAAKLCYSSAGMEELQKKIETKDQAGFVEKLIGVGHSSPLEHISFTFGIEGISRACSHQLVRHRIASYSQQSQRYVRADGFDYIIPPSIKQDVNLVREFEHCMEEAQQNYTKILKRLEELGYQGEAGQQDARYLLPNAAETKIIVTMNARELVHFFKLRCCNRAQWEIRAMAERMLGLVKNIAPTIFAKAGPGCLDAACPEGKMTCGKSDEVRKKYDVKK
ncbi:MAG: FAD-dependent thymidylate synthase [Nitrospirota bacterium]